MFEAAEREQNISRGLRLRMQPENQMKERSDPDITISMSHGDDLNEGTDSQRRLQKSRIGGSNMVEIQRDFEKTEGNCYENKDTFLNNDGSKDLRAYLEQRYPETNSSEPGSYSSEIVMSSKYGQNYMKNQKLKAQERKSNKLSRQIKKDDDKDRQDSSNLSMYQKQIQERIERKRQGDSLSMSTNEDTLCGRMTNSYFTSRQHTLGSISKDLHDKNRLVVNTNDDVEIEDNTPIVSTIREDPMIDIDRKHREKLRQEDQMLDRMKKELQDGTETKHPSKFITQRHGSTIAPNSLNNPQPITDIRQNMFMVNLDPSKIHRDSGNRVNNINPFADQDSEDSKLLDSSGRQNDNSDIRHADSIYIGDSQASNRNHEYISGSKMGQTSSMKSYEQRGASGSSLGYGGPKGYGYDYSGYGSNNQTSSVYSGQQMSIYHNNQAKSSKYNQSQYPQSNYLSSNFQGSKEGRDYKQGKGTGAQQNQFYNISHSNYPYTRIYDQRSIHGIGNMDSSSPYSRTTSSQNPYTHQSSSFNQRGVSTPYGTPTVQTVKYFYESPSKYISLKKFSEELFHLADLNQASQKKGQKSDALMIVNDQPVQSIYTSSVQKQLKSSKQELNLQSWFQKLLNHEKAIALTIIDQDLVNLIKAMHPMYQDYGHGTYAAYIPNSGAYDSERYFKVGNYNLLFKKPAFNEQDGFSSDYNRMKSYDYYGPVPSQDYNKDKKMKDYQEKLISNIKVIEVGSDEAITLSNELLENTEFFLQIMQTIDNQFMGSELKIEKSDLQAAMHSSVFTSGKASSSTSHFGKYDNEKQNEGSNQAGLRKQGGRGGQTHQRDLNTFFTLNERDISTRMASSGNAQDFKARASQYNKMGTKPYPSSSSNSQIDKDVVKDKAMMSFGQILSHIFEKSINIQYQEYQGKLSNPMKDFFYTSNEHHMYSQDLKLAKFWRDLKPKERDQFWKTIDGKQDEILGQIKQTEQYNKLQHCEEITEETETETDSNGNMSFAKFKSKPLKYGKRSNYYKDSNSSFSERRSISEEDASDSGDQWAQPGSRKKSGQQRRATKLSRTYVDFNKPDDTDEESADKHGWSRNRSASDSDDIENQKRSCRTQSAQQQAYYDQGYRPLENYIDDKFNNKNSSNKRTILKKPIGSGARKALDQMSDYSDRTVTEKSDESDSQNNIVKEQCLDDPTAFGTYNDKSNKSKVQDKKQYKAIRGADNFYTGNERMKAIYSTQMDKDDNKSEGEITYNNDDKYDSNYEGEEFEDQDDEDDDDDFALPKNHEQNMRTDKQKTQNIKQWIQENQKKEANEKCSLQLQTTPRYQSTGSQATKDEIAKQAKQKKKAQSKKKKAKKPFEYEETKSETLSKQQLVKTKAQITQNKENQKENQLRKWYKIILAKLQGQQSGEKAIPCNNNTAKLKVEKTTEISELNLCYLFIRHISTYKGLQNPKNVALDNMVLTKLHEVVYNELRSQSEAKLLNDLITTDDSKTKKTAGGATKLSGSVDKAPTAGGEGGKEVLDGAQAAAVLKAGEKGPNHAKNQKKKRSKMAKKEREEREAAEAVKSQQVDDDVEEYEKDSLIISDQVEKERKEEKQEVKPVKLEQKPVKQEQKPEKLDQKPEQINQQAHTPKAETKIIEVIDDIVFTGPKEKPNETKKEELQAKTVLPIENDESNNQNSKYRQRKNKKKRQQKGQKGANEEEKEAAGQLQDGEKDMEDHIEEVLKTSEKDLESGEPQQEDYQSVVQMLEKLKNEDATLRKSESDILEQAKEELFPHGISLGFFNDLNSKPENDIHHLREGSSEAEKKRENAKTLFNQLSDMLAKRVGYKGSTNNDGGFEEEVIANLPRSATKYVEERRGLLSGEFQNKYPDEKEIDIAYDQDYKFKEDIDIDIDEIGRDLEEDEDLQIFKADIPGLRKRSANEIENAIEKQKKDATRLMYQENEDLLSSLNEMNDELKKSDAYNLKMKGMPAMKITDLKQQREKDEKLKKFQKDFNSISTDYKERAKDIEKMGADEEKKTGVDGENVEDGATKKKKKHKKKKKKKADAAESQTGDVELPETIAGAAERASKEGKYQWQKDLELTLKKKENSDDESPRSKHSDVFDDNFFETDETYQAASQLVQKTGGSINSEQLQSNKQDDEDDQNDILKTDDIELIMPYPDLEDGFKVDISKCQKYAKDKKTDKSPKSPKIEEIEEVIDTSAVKNLEESKGQMPSSARVIASQSQASSIQMDPITNSYHIQNQKTQNFQLTVYQDTGTQQYTSMMAKKFIEDCIQSIDGNDEISQNKTMIQQDDIQAIANVLGRQQTGSTFTSIDPVIRLDRNDLAEEQKMAEEQQDMIMENIYINQLQNDDDTEDPNQDESQQTTLSKKKQAKQDKKKEAKQNAKKKAMQIKQQQEELKQQKAQQREEMLRRKQETKVYEEQKQIEEEKLQIEIMKQSQKNLKLPDLKTLNADNQSQNRASPQTSQVRQSKKVKFQRDESYDGSKVPKRGSSRGTSMASSNKAKEDSAVNELAELFPNEYTKPPESTTQSIKDSLNNSKKNSPQCSTNKSQNEGGKTDAEILQQKLDDLQKTQNFSISKMRASSLNSEKQISKRKSSIDSNQKIKNPQINNLIAEPAVEKPSKKNKSKNKNQQEKQQQLSQANLTNQKQTAQKSQDRKNSMQRAKQIAVEGPQTSVQQPIPQMQIVKPDPKLTKQEKKKANKEKQKLEKEKQQQNQIAAQATGGQKSMTNLQVPDVIKPGSSGQSNKEKTQQKKKAASSQNRPDTNQQQKPEAAAQSQISEAPQTGRQEKKGKVDSQVDKNSDRNSSKNQQKSKPQPVQGDKKSQKSTGKVKEEAKQPAATIATGQASYVAKGSQQQNHMIKSQQATNPVLTNQKNVMRLDAQQHQVGSSQAFGSAASATTNNTRMTQSQGQSDQQQIISSTQYDQQQRRQNMGNNNMMSTANGHQAQQIQNGKIQGQQYDSQYGSNAALGPVGPGTSQQQSNGVKGNRMMADQNATNNTEVVLIPASPAANPPNPDHQTNSTNVASAGGYQEQQIQQSTDQQVSQQAASQGYGNSSQQFSGAAASLGFGRNHQMDNNGAGQVMQALTQNQQSQQPPQQQQATGGIAQPDQMVISMMNAAVGSTNTQQNNQGDSGQQQQSQTQIQIDFVRFTVQHGQVPMSQNNNNGAQVVPQQPQSQTTVNVQSQQNQVQFMNNWQQQLQQQQQMQNFMPHQYSQGVNRGPNQNSQQQALQQQQQLQGYMQNMAGLQNNIKNMPNFLNLQNMQNMLNQGNLMPNFNPAANMANLNQANMPQNINLRNMPNMSNITGSMNMQPGSNNATGLMNFGNMGGAMSQPGSNLGITNLNQLGNQFGHQMMPGGNQAQGQQPNLQQMLMPQNQNLAGQQRLMPNIQNNMALQQQNQINSMANQNQNPQQYQNNSLGQMMPNLGMGGSQQQFNQQQQLNQAQLQQPRSQQAQATQQQANVSAPQNFGQPFQPFNTQQQHFAPTQANQQQLRTSPQQIPYHHNSFMHQSHQMNNQNHHQQQKVPTTQQQQDAPQQFGQGQPGAGSNSGGQASGPSAANSQAAYQQMQQQLYLQQMMQQQQQLYQQQQNLINNQNQNNSLKPQTAKENRDQNNGDNTSNQQQSLSQQLQIDSQTSKTNVRHEDSKESKVIQAGADQIGGPFLNSASGKQSPGGGVTAAHDILQGLQTDASTKGPLQSQHQMPMAANFHNQLQGQKNDGQISEIYGKKKRDQQFQQPPVAQLFQSDDPTQQHLSSKSANFTPSGNQKQYQHQQNAQQLIVNANSQPQYYQAQPVTQYDPLTGVPQPPQQQKAHPNQQQLQLPAQQHQPTASVLYNNQRNTISPQQHQRMMQNQQQVMQSPQYNTMFPQFTYQQQMMMSKIQELQMQGYVIHQNDISTLQNCSYQELECVHEFYDVLDAQILNLRSDQESKLQKTQKLRQIAFEMIRDKIKEVYREKYKNRDSKSCDVKVEIFGSMATGLAIDSSDLDILVHDFINQDSPRFQHLSRIALIEEMQELHQALNDIFALKTNSLIESATVPVIKLQMNLVKLCERERERDPDFEISPRNLNTDEDMKTLNIDITLDEPKRKEEKNKGNAAGLNQPEHLGLQCCKYIKQKLEEYPKMKIIALIFKKFLSLKDLNKPFSGGLSSYSLVQMILAVMKFEEQQGMHNKLNAAMIFKHFIHEYAENFQPLQKGIGQDGQYHDIREFCYIFHTPSCNINVRANEPDDQDENQQAEQQPKSTSGPDASKNNSATIRLDKHICTCGYINNSKGPSKQDAVGGSVSGDPNNPKENQLVNLLQKLLLNNNNQQNRIDNNGMPESNDYKTRTMQQSHFLQPQLMIIDPLNKFNNIGKSSYNFGVIQQELRDVYLRLNLELQQFIRYAANRKNQQQSGIYQYGEEFPAPDIDGLIPRIFDIDFKISQNEPFEAFDAQPNEDIQFNDIEREGSSLRDAEPFNPTNQLQMTQIQKSQNIPKEIGTGLKKQTSSHSGGSSGKKGQKLTPTKEEQKTASKVSNSQSTGSFGAQEQSPSNQSQQQEQQPSQSSPGQQQQQQAKTKIQDGQNTQLYSTQHQHKSQGQKKKKEGQKGQNNRGRGNPNK